jgi:peroxiredoxin
MAKEGGTGSHLPMAVWWQPALCLDTVMQRLATLALALALSAPALAALKPGSPAPSFTAPAFLAGKPFTFDLAATLKSGPVVVYFFPAAFTSGCNAEAAAFSQAIDKFKAQGVSVIGVTAGNVDRLAEFSKDTEKCAGKFPVAADPGAKIAKTFDATMTLKPDLASRTSYLIGKDGRIAAEFDAMNPNQHVKQMLDAVTALKAKAAQAK